MPILYLPRYFTDLDYRLLCWLDQHGSKSEISFEMLDHFNMNPIYLEKAFKRLSKDGLLLLKLQGSAIIEVELTSQAQSLLAEHILGESIRKRSK